MAPNEFESPWIFGLHDPGGEQIMLDAGKPGWVVFTEALGHDASDRSGRDYRPYSSRGLGIIARLNHGYYPNGTLPHSRYYGDFAQRCANFVAASPGCRIWIIGNEPNSVIERPMVQSGGGARRTWWSRLWGLWQRMGGAPRAAQDPLQADPSQSILQPMPAIEPPADDPRLHGLPLRFAARMDAAQAAQAQAQASRAVYLGEVITPWLYAECYRACRAAIKRLRGHEQDLVLVAGPAPWNNQTIYQGNERGDWVDYLEDVLQLLGPDECDGLALHAYTHGANPAAITSEARMIAPYNDRRYEFRAYRDFLEAVPLSMRDMPVYITEADQIDPWRDADSGWVAAAYAEIDEWNRLPGTQKIHALALYRWPRHDRWYIEGKQGVIEDFQRALAQDYRWDRDVPTPAAFNVGERLQVLAYVTLRRTPGYVGKGTDDQVAELRPGQAVVVHRADSVEVDGLVWWRVAVESSAAGGGAVGDEDAPMNGWLAQYGPDGAALIERAGEPAPERAPSFETQPGPELQTSAEPQPQPERESQPEPQPQAQPPTPRLKLGDHACTTTIVNARRTPGHLNKPANDIASEVAQGTNVQLGEGPQIVDGLVWWRVRAPSGGWFGWMAENAPDGAALLERIAAPAPTQPAGRFKPGDRAMTVAFVRLRRTPGFLNKPADDVIADIWQGTPVTILGGPASADDLTWWEVETQSISGQTVRGWMAESAPGGIPLLDELTSEDRTPFKPGDLGVVGQVPVRVRRTPGHLNKPDDDVLGEFPARRTLYLIEGPRSVDGLEWWRASGITGHGKAIGWVAQGAPAGGMLVGRAPKLPGTDTPNLREGKFLATPFHGQFGITQLWGENPSFYARFSYDGAALLGHNGIDFATPQGTPVVATDAGTVTMAGYEAGGFGNFILLDHAWGQSIYAHLDRIDVQQGQGVARGAVLGLSGNTGNSSGPHLHFAIRVSPYVRTDGWGGYTDPLPYLDPGAVFWPAYMLDAPPAFSGGPLPITDRRPPPGMAEDAPGLIRP